MITIDDLKTSLNDVLRQLSILRGSIPLDDPLKDRLDELFDYILKKRLRIAKKVFEEGTAKYEAVTSRLKSINEELLSTIDDINKIAETFDSLTRLVTALDDLLNLATSIAGGDISFRAAVEERATIRSAEKMSHRVDPSVVEHLMQAPPAEISVVDGPPKSRPVAPIPVEEVLHGIELTDEKLIITVATGGCTEEDSFHVYVDKGYTGLPPYQVTVYRIKPDDCKGNFEPVRISFSRRELGLEGNVDFRILNRIGNTSNHRLKP
ncbi:hypothetical protein [Candidatus Electrothrix sp.]|uniref:hypothetical protein n=1 Tax=Candidatus Electrothrix sp. TaxID=2170559 RepID=UPI00405648E2